jgi:hypothetical protein
MREQPSAPMSLPETTAEAVPVKTNVLPAGTSLEEELEKYEEYWPSLLSLSSLVRSLMMHTKP